VTCSPALPFSSLALAIALVSTVAHAEPDPEGRQVHLGLTGTGSLTTVVVTGAANPFDRKVGFGGGLTATSEIRRDILSLQLELLYASLGMTATVAGPFAEEQEEIPTSLLITDFGTLQFPFRAQLRFLRLEHWALWLGAGPSATLFLFRRNRNLEGPWRRTHSEDLRRLTFGITAGLGADFDLGFGRLTVELRFDRDLLSFVRPIDDGPERFYHTAFGLRAGLALPILTW
jgi:hypothetical protein